MTNLFKTLFSNKLIIVESPFQYLNLIEFFYQKKKYKKKFSSQTITVNMSNKCKNEEKIFSDTLNYTKSSNTFLKNNFFFLRSVNRLFFLLVFIVRKHLGFKYDICIIGNYQSNFQKNIYQFSKNRIIIDDGTNTLEFKENFKLNRKDMLFFSCFPKRFINATYLKNNYSFLKKKNRKKKKIKKNLLILGNGFTEKKIISKNSYLEFLKKIKKKYAGYKIDYYPHSIEKKENFENYFDFNIIENREPIETYLVNQKKAPEIILSSYSTALFTLSMFLKKIDLVNYVYLNKKVFIGDSYHKLKMKFKKIKKLYMQKNITNRPIFL